MLFKYAWIRKISIYLLFCMILIYVSSFVQIGSQLSTSSISSNFSQNLVTYQKQSNFIHEFPLPFLNERGLKGIATDSKGNAWFYHSTNATSMIVKMNTVNKSFTSYPVVGDTITDDAVINLAGGQLVFDKNRNSFWFTDARTNSLGRIDADKGIIESYKIPTNNSGIMGIALSPDRKSVWFTEIIGNKIGNFHIDTKSITEYPAGNSTGPTLLTFDSRGVLWVTLSYSNSILKVEPWLLVPESRVTGMTEITLQKPDTFSPFGIAIARNKDGVDQMIISDHGSSRIILSDLNSELRNYTSYWTSPSQAYPMSLPSQVISDKLGNVYFPQHQGNKISKISADTGIMTEFDVPTGPVATVVFIAISQDGGKVWFTEWASNKIAYLDNRVPVPLSLKIHNDNQNMTAVLRNNQTYPIDITIRTENNTSSPIPLLRFDEVELSLIGMTDSGLAGLTYTANPQRPNMTETSIINGSIDLKINNKAAIPGKYTVMTRVSMSENDFLVVSLLYPQLVTLDVPLSSQLQNKQTSQEFSPTNTGPSDFTVSLRDIARFASIAVALILISYLVYRKIGKSILKKG